MPQSLNYLQNFRAPDIAGVDRSRYSNALLRNEVDRLPQQNQAQDLAIRGDQQMLDVRNQAMTAEQQKNAAGIVGRGFAMIAGSPRARDTARAFISSPDFQSAGKMLGLPLDQFSVTDQDDENALRQQAQAWAQALSGQTAQQQRVQSTFTGRNGNQWIVRSDGQTVDTGVPVSQFAQRPLETGAGIEAFDPARGTTAGPISPAAAAPALDAAAQARKEAEALGSGRGQAQAQTEAQAPQRAARAQQQITAIDNTISALDQAMAGVNWSTVGTAGALSRAIPGTPAYDLAQTLLTVKANIGFDRLQQMRESSPTGGALGQVAVQELNALQASIAALDQSQSGEQLRQNLMAVKQHYNAWKATIQQAQSAAPQQLGGNTGGGWGRVEVVR